MDGRLVCPHSFPSLFSFSTVPLAMTLLARSVLFGVLLIVALACCAQAVPSSSHHHRKEKIHRCKGLLKHERAFCTAYLHGNKPPQQTNTATTTLTSVLPAKTVTQVKSFTKTSTGLSTVTATVTMTSTVSTTTTISTSATYTSGTPVAKRHHVSVPTAVVEFDAAIITDACFLVLYGELSQSPASTTKTVKVTSTPPVKTVLCE